uniref:SAP domain-containing protein n=1 Tax=Amphora coffeiformis TaxID=265554 RepID=A0A7S3P5F1_9STRA|eukprot:scaffold7786_cov159-Amphora_coffeaeformis.AAC.2
MATYPVGIPSLPAPASGLDDNPAPAISIGDALHDDHVAAATRQHKTRKYLAHAYSPQVVTDAELVASKRRKHQVESANFEPGATPMWAQVMQQTMADLQQTMQQNMADLQQNMADLQQTTQQNKSYTDNLIIRESQRSMNRSRKRTLDPIEMLIRVDEGDTPAGHPNTWFPANQNEFNAATVANLQSLLRFYGQESTGDRTTLQKRLMKFLGVTH